jgi:hypothetical protein
MQLERGALGGNSGITPNSQQDRCWKRFVELLKSSPLEVGDGLEWRKAVRKVAKHRTYDSFMRYGRIYRELWRKLNDREQALFLVTCMYKQVDPETLKPIQRGKSHIPPQVPTLSHTGRRDNGPSPKGER